MSDLSKRILVRTLLATRDSLTAAITQTDVALIALGIDPDTGEDAPCEHPPESIRDESTLAQFGPFTCLECGATQDTPFHPTGD